MKKNGAKMIWAGADSNKTVVNVLAEIKDIYYMKTFGDRSDIAKRRQDAAADVASMTVISQIDYYFINWPNKPYNVEIKKSNKSV